MRRRNPRGFSLMEVVVASAITLLVLTSGGIVVANTQKTVNASVARDSAASLGMSVIDAATAFGCGLVVDPAKATEVVVQRCGAVYRGVGSVSDAEFAATDSEGRPYQVQVSTRWRQVNSGTACRSTDVSRVGRAQLASPALLERTVLLRWTVAGAAREQSFSQLQAAPSTSEFQSAGLGGVLVSAPANTLVFLSSVDGLTIPRFAASCTGGVSTGAAWFPYLPEGEYLVAVSGGGGTPVTVGSGDVVEVRL